MWQHLDLSLGEEDISNAGKINFLGRKTRFPREERKSSSAIFWFRAIWLRSKRLPFGAMWIGNDLEMSGVL